MKEVIKLEDKIWDLVQTLIAILATKGLDELVEVLKKKKTNKKDPQRNGKHVRRS